jgi:cell division protein FtsL
MSSRWRLVIAAVVVVAGFIMFSFSGLVVNGYRLNRQAEALRQNIQELKTENDQLQQEATNLESDQGLEKLAREELGWVKPGDVAIITIPTNSEEQVSQSAPKAQAPEIPHWQRWWDMFFGQ